MTNRQIFLLLLLLMTRMMIAFQLNYVRMGSLIILGNVADSDFLLLLFFGGGEITRHSLLLHSKRWCWNRTWWSRRILSS